MPAQTSSTPFIIVAVDGGAASGKSSLARALAQRFNFLHVDTGAHYRAVTLALRRMGVDPGDPAAVPAALAQLPLNTQIDGRSARIALGGKVPEDAELRSPEVNASVSRFAALPAVRQFLFGYQRRQADVARTRGFAGLVMEGRDIGSVIFPDADRRIFLTADPATRARRRAAEGQADAVVERDRLDTSRATAPLVCPPGATVIDSSNLTLDEVVTRAVELVEKTPPAVVEAPPAPEFPWFYRRAWQVTRAFMQVVGRAEVAGVENVPRAGAFLLTSNHASFLDPPLLGCFLSRPICYFARKTLWKPGPMSWMLDHLKCIPVDRDGEADIGAFRRVIAALKTGEGVQIFLEGTRTADGNLQTPRRGIGLLAARLGVPVVPARVFGTFATLNRRQWFPRPFYRLGVTYGRPLQPRDYDPGSTHPERHEVIAQRLLHAIRALPAPWEQNR